MGCSNIFDRPLLATTTYGSTVYLQNPGVDQYIKYLPYQLNKDSKPGYIKINRNPKKVKSDDFCIVFDYAAMNSTLLVGVDHEFHYRMPTFTKPGFIEDGKKLCASYFTNNPKAANAMYLQFEQVPLTNIKENYIAELSNSEWNGHNLNPSLEEGIYLDNHNANSTEHIFDENQLINGDFFKFSNKIEGEYPNMKKEKKIVFSMSKMYIHAFNASEGKDYVHQDRIQTKWFKASKSLNQQIRLGLNVVGEDFKKYPDYFKLSASVSSIDQINIATKQQNVSIVARFAKLHNIEGYICL